MEINQAKLTGYRRLVQSGRRSIDEIPEPYQQVLRDEGFN